MGKSATNGTRGKRLSTRAIEQICQGRLGTRKAHVMRHSFARALENAGAKVSEIQARLGHESLATTGRYLVGLRADENPHADALAALFGRTPSRDACNIRINRQHPSIWEQNYPAKNRQDRLRRHHAAKKARV